MASARADVLSAARDYVARGLSVIPIRPDGTKRRATEWKGFQKHLPSGTDLERWFGHGTAGIGIVCGVVSGNLLGLDFEAAAPYERLLCRVYDDGAALLDGCPIARTPR